MDMKEQRWGMEIEMTGLTRCQAAKVVAKYFHTSYSHDEGFYDKYSVPDRQGRRWSFVSDASIQTESRNGYTGGSYSVELVTPICRYDDIPDLQEIVRRLRKEGAISDKEHMCGIHIHVDASPFDARTLRNLTNIMYSKEDLIYKALQVDVERENRYCQKVEERFLQQLNAKKPRDLEGVEQIWYGGESRRYKHYDGSRYHCLNLHSVFQKGTVEFRLFNGTLHAGMIRSYLSLALAITAQALNQTSAGRQKTRSTNEKYTFRTWLLRLGMIGKEFENPRKHLLEHLEGNIAWKDPAQAERQRERNRIKRELERQQAAQQAPQIQDDNQAEPEESGSAFTISM